MIKELKPNNKIFTSNEFSKDKQKFSLIIQNLQSEELELFGDEENYVACRGSKKFPTWIWTKDNIDESLLPEIEEVLKLYQLDVDTRFTCKRELYDFLKKDNFEELGDYFFELGFLTCTETIKPKKYSGYLDKATEEDKDILVEFIYNSSQEISDIRSLTKEEAEERFYKKLEKGTYYVWKNDDGEIVAQAEYTLAEGNAKVAAVYTKKSERKKGYAACLIYELTNIILKEGYSVFLYTDYRYLPSNTAYKNVGYKDQDTLINFSLRKKK